MKAYLKVFVHLLMMSFVMEFPSSDVILKDGDIINVDATSELNGYYADASRMFMMGNVSDEAKKTC